MKCQKCWKEGAKQRRTPLTAMWLCDECEKTEDDLVEGGHQ